MAGVGREKDVAQVRAYRGPPAKQHKKSVILESKVGDV